MDTIGSFNNLLLTQNNLLSLCCCDNRYEMYWEAIPCDAYSLPGVDCFTPLVCSLYERRYISTESLCEGDNYVCECQRLKISFWDDLVTSSATAASITLSSTFSSCTGYISDDGIQLSFIHTSSDTIYNQLFNYTTYPLIDNLSSGINNYQVSGVSPFSFTNYHLSNSGISDSFATGTITINTSTETFLTTKNAGIFFEFEENRSQFIPFNSDQNAFRANLENGIRTINGLSELTVTSDASNNSSNDKIYYITFAGERCGYPQSNITVLNRLIAQDSNGMAPIPQMSYGQYVSSYSNEGTEYIRVPSGTVTCPYEDPFYDLPNGPDGFAVFNEDLQCCPQKGAHLGDNQVLYNKEAYGQDFHYLENTILVDGSFQNKCYKLNKFFFLFGKEGRFNDDPTRLNHLHIRSDCDYTTTGCTFDLPSNCVPELFISSFHKNIPWGPFGSYYYGIETQEHPATNLWPFGENYMGDNQFKGVDYTPTGQMYTAGSWTNTTGIRLEFLFYKMVPFYIGTGVPDRPIDRVVGKFDVSSLSSDLILTSGNTGSGLTVLTFATSGKSVLDFITAVNGLMTQEVSGVSCQIFNFCPAISNSGLATIPSSKINNLSSELFNVWKVSPSNGSNPNIDSKGYSAGSIWPAPKIYDDMLMSDPLGSRPNIYNTGSISRSVSMPIPCRRTNSNINFTSYDGIYRQNCRPFWTTFQGQSRNVLNLSPITSTGIDPEVNAINISVNTSGDLFVSVSSGTTEFGSTGIYLSTKTSGFHQQNLADVLNNIEFGWNTAPSKKYKPVVTSSGDVDFYVYLGDNSWWDGSSPTNPGVGSVTPGNFSYREPLLP